MFNLVLALVAYAGPNDCYWDQKRPDDPFWTNVAVPIATVSQRLQGRILASIIQKGMTRETTDLILGKQRMNCVVSRTSRGAREAVHFGALGITIWYFCGVVEDVGCRPIFPDKSKTVMKGP
jgi:hypothetical protein